MSFNKITTSDLTNKGVSGLPDTPGLSTSEMQRKFDEIGKEVIVPKFNELVDELNKNGNVIKASDIVGIRVNANKQIEVTTDFNTWYATASSGHVVIDKYGNTLPQRGTMKFVGESLVYDDPENEQTVITAIQGAQGEEGPIGPVGPKGDRGQVYIPSIDEQGNISWTPADYTVPPAVRNIRGPQGVQGVQGPRGERGYNGKDGRSFSVLGQYESLEALQIAHPVGNEGDAYSVQLAEGNTIYLWDVDKREWVDIGSLQGPQGPQGEQGIQGIQGPPGIQGERGIPTSVNGLIGESIEVTPEVIPYTENKSLAALLGTTDISEYSDGTVTGAIKSACDKADANEAAIADVNSNLGTPRFSLRTNYNSELTDCNKVPPGFCSAYFKLNTPTGHEDNCFILTLPMNNDLDCCQQFAWTTSNATKTYRRYRMNGATYSQWEAIEMEKKCLEKTDGSDGDRLGKIGIDDTGLYLYIDGSKHHIQLRD